MYTLRILSSKMGLQFVYHVEEEPYDIYTRWNNPKLLTEEELFKAIKHLMLKGYVYFEIREERKLT